MVLTENGEVLESRLKGLFRTKGIKTTNPVAVGDNVELEKDEEGKGMINAIAERKNYIIRKSINLSKQTQIVAANIDQALLIVTLALPKTSAGFIDRFLITAEAYHIPVKIIFNKIDLFSDENIMKELDEFISIYEKIGYECIKTSTVKNSNIDVLKNITKDKTTLVAGHSGVGKSSILNAMDKNLDLKTGIISEQHNKGKHTTTFAEMHPLSYGGFIIDTPGIQELSLVDMKKEEVANYFPEMFAIKHKCKFNNCLHINEPKCAILEAVERNEISPSRYDSYLGIINGEETVTKYE